MSEVKKHHEALKKLEQLELRLVSLISDTNNSELMDCYLDFQKARTLCQDTFFTAIEEGFKNKKA